MNIKDDFIDDDNEIELKDERATMIRSKVGLSMWRINLFLLLALLLLMIALKIPIATWCTLVSNYKSCASSIWHSFYCVEVSLLGVCF